MKCESIQDWLLQCETLQPRAWPREVAKHVKTCVACRTYARSLKQLESAWRHQPVPVGAAKPSTRFLKKVLRLEEPAQVAGRSWMRPLRWAVPLVGVAAMLLIGVGVTGYLLFMPNPAPAAESKIVEQLIEWNTELASADAVQRKQMLQEKEERFREDLKKAKIPEDERAMAEKLLDVARRLGLNGDLVEEAELLTEVADKLAARADAADKKGDKKVAERCGIGYSMFMEKTYNPFFKRIEDLKVAKSNGPPDKKGGFDFSKQQKQFDKIWERSPQRTRPDLHKKYDGMFKKGFTSFHKYGGGKR